MKDLEFWKFIQKKLEIGETLHVVCVVHCEGSTPGKPGFKMAVSSDGSTIGTIGGGSVEHNITNDIKLGLFTESINLIKNVLDKNSAQGLDMICSGSQFTTIVKFEKEKLEFVSEVLESITGSNEKQIVITEKGIKIINSVDSSDNISFVEEGSSWRYVERISDMDHIYIFGSGHVGIKLSEIMKFLGFYITVIDNREKADTFISNIYADEKILSDYTNCEKLIPKKENSYVVILTHGHKHDKDILKQLIEFPFKYLGMIGSRKKVKTTFEELLHEGISQSNINKVKAPIGIPISSQTAEEIAISIAAEIIKVKNSGDFITMPCPQ